MQYNNGYGASSVQSSHYASSYESSNTSYHGTTGPMIHQQVQYMEGMPTQSVVQVQHVQPNPIMQTRNYTTSTTYQMPGASQTTSKFCSSRSGRIEAPKTFTVEEDYQEEIPIYQPPVVETRVMQQAIPMQYIGQQQQYQYVEQQQQQYQYMEQPQQIQYMMPQQQQQVQYVQHHNTHVVQPQTQIMQQQQYQFVEVEGPPQYVQVPGPKQLVEVPQPPLLVEMEGPPQVVEIPSPRQLVQVPVSHTTMVSTSSVPVVSFSSSSFSSSTSVNPSFVKSVTNTSGPAASRVTYCKDATTGSNNTASSASTSSSSTTATDRVSFHVPPSSPGRSSMPYRTVTPDTTPAPSK